eukprot:4648671-Prymnesium_polylepis.1
MPQCPGLWPTMRRVAARGKARSVGAPSIGDIGTSKQARRQAGANPFPGRWVSTGVCVSCSSARVQCEPVHTHHPQ